MAKSRISTKSEGQKMTNSDIPFVAVDDGYAQTKVWGDSPSGGAPVKLVVRTSIRPGRHGLGSLTGDGVIDCYHTPENEDFTISDDIVGENTQFDSFHVSTMNRVLVNHALAKAGYQGHSLHLITGLPVGDYFDASGVVRTTKINAKKENLAKGVTRVSSDEPLARIEKVDVGCQAVAAWIDRALDDALEPRCDIAGRAAIIDIGGRTTDIAVVVNGKAVDHASLSTKNIGVLDVYQAVAKGISKNFDVPADDIPLVTLDKAVRERKVRIWSKWIDIEQIVEDAVVEVESQILREIERKIGKGAMLESVVFVGGGANLFSNLCQAFPNGIVLEDPEFANARGLWKFGRLIRRR